MSTLREEWPCKRWQTMFPRGAQAGGPKVRVFGECLMLRFNTCSFCMPPKELKGTRAGDGRHEKKKGEKGEKGASIHKKEKTHRRRQAKSELIGTGNRS